MGSDPADSSACQWPIPFAFFAKGGQRRRYAQRGFKLVAQQFQTRNYS